MSSHAEKDNELFLSCLKKTTNEYYLRNDVTYPVIHNIVSTVNVNTTTNPKQMAARLLSTEFKPNKFAATISRKDGSTTLGYDKGTLVCVGSKSVYQTIASTQQHRLLLEKYGCNTKDNKIEIHNKVYNTNIGHGINLQQLQNYLYDTTIYVPILFPGLILIFKLAARDDDGKPRKIVFLIFNTGNIICMGIKHKGEEAKAGEVVIPILKKFRRDSIPKKSSERYKDRIIEKSLWSKRQGQKQIWQMYKDAKKNSKSGDSKDIVKLMREELKKLEENVNVLKPGKQKTALKNEINKVELIKLGTKRKNKDNVSLDELTKKKKYYDNPKNVEDLLSLI